MLSSDADNNISYGGSNWAFQIKEILQSHGFANLFLTHDVSNISFMAIKQGVMDVYYQTLYRGVNNSSRLTAYCKFKYSFEQEKYLRKYI